MDLSAYRASPLEQARIASLLALMPETFPKGMDIGARDGYISLRMAQRADHITALDLSLPDIHHEKITCVQGDATALAFPDNAFDVVACAEVLEHIASPALELACQEIIRITKRFAIIGVPFQQDQRFGASRCPACGKTNPPWGHVNSFSVAKLTKLFAPLYVSKIDYIGTSRARTNGLSHALMEYAGHPYGTYTQAEPCVFCGASLHYEDHRTLAQQLATRFAHDLTAIQQKISRAQPIWVHFLFEKR